MTNAQAYTLTMEAMPGASSERTATSDPETVAWLDGLAAAGPSREKALRRLHALLLRAARREASRRAGGSRVMGVELADLAQQAADDALVAIIDKLADFRGESRFTTWAYKFVVLEVASKLARHVWRATSAADSVEDWAALPDRFGFTPEEALEQRELLRAIRAAVDGTLTPRQRRVFVALVLNAVPLDALAAELHTNRNALHKALFDARRKVRAYLVANGYTGFQCAPRRTSSAFFTPDPHDAGCGETFALLHVYVERELAYGDAAERYPGIVAHLEACGPCLEDYRGLRALLA